MIYYTDNKINPAIYKNTSNSNTHRTSPPRTTNPRICNHLTPPHHLNRIGRRFPREHLKTRGLGDGAALRKDVSAGELGPPRPSRAPGVQLQHLAVAGDQHGDEDALQPLTHVVSDPEGLGTDELGQGGEGGNRGQQEGDLEEVRVFEIRWGGFWVGCDGFR